MMIRNWRITATTSTLYPILAPKGQHSTKATIDRLNVKQ